MTTHNHGCGNAQQNIQKNILWVWLWWLDRGMVVELLRKIFQKIFVVWDGDSWGEPWLWHRSEKYSKKYSLDGMVTAGQSHGCGTAQKIIQKNILWIGSWWLGRAKVVALLRQIFKKIFFGLGGDSWAGPWLWHCSENYSKKYSLGTVVMAGQRYGCGTAQKNIPTNICCMGWW